MIQYIRRVMNPAWYHGYGRKPPFFEGWYYKLINRDESQRFAIIPGVFINQDPAKTHAFIQVLDGNTGHTTYHTIGSFEARPDDFDVRVGASHFSLSRIQLDVDDDIGRIQGEVRFDGITPWPVRWNAPGIMGWYGWLPFLECYHGVLSLDHNLEGTLEIYGQTVNFDKGRGYIEKDWGKSFPSGYIWFQTNHFDRQGTSLTASIGVVPGLGRPFAGFIVGLWHKGTLYSFTTYNGSKVEQLAVTDSHVTWRLYNQHYVLNLLCTRAEGGLLKGPEREAMHKRVDETLQASVEVELIAIEGLRQYPVFQGQGRNMGLEVVGDLSMILKP